MTKMQRMSNPFDQGYFNSEELRSFGFKRIGECVRISKNCTIIGLENIDIGNNVRIDGNVSIIASLGELTVGNYIHIGSCCHLNCAGGVKLSDFSGLSQGVRIYSGTDDYSGQFLTNPTIPHKYVKARLAPVFLGRHVIIGSGTVILPGVSIGDGASVGALSFVSKSLESWGVYFGMPAKRLRSRSRKLLELEKQLLDEIEREKTSGAV